MLFSTLVLQSYLRKWAKGKRKMIPFWGKKTKKNQNIVIMMLSVVGKGTLSPVKLKLEGEIFE